MKTRLFSSISAATILLLNSGLISHADEKLGGRPRPIGSKQAPIKIGTPSEVGFLRDAIYYARNAQIMQGGKKIAEPVIFATVTMVSLEPTPKTAFGAAPDGTQVFYAQGPLKAVPDSSMNAIEGKLTLWSNTLSTNKNSAPFANNNSTIDLFINQNGRTIIQYQVDGRNRMGQGPFSFQPNTDTDMVLTSTLDYMGQKRAITITLTRGQVPVTVTSAASEKKPIGARYELTSQFVVTNSDDGIGDNTVELAGKIYFNDFQNPFFEIQGSFGSGKSVNHQPIIFNQYFNNSKTNRLKISGWVYDKDSASGIDTLWKTETEMLLSNMALSKNGRTIKGDIDDESGDLIVKVRKIADLY